MDVWGWHRGIRRAMYRDQNVTGRARARAGTGALGRERAAGKAAERGREFYRGRRLGVRKRREGDKAKRESGLQTWQYEAGTPWKYNDFDQIFKLSPSVQLFKLCAPHICYRWARVTRKSERSKREPTVRRGGSLSQS